MRGSAGGAARRERAVATRWDRVASAVLLVVLGAAAFLASRFGYSDVPGPGALQFFAPAVAVLILLVVEPIAVHRAVRGRPVLPVVLLGAALLGLSVLSGLVRYDLIGFPGW